MTLHRKALDVTSTIRFNEKYPARNRAFVRGAGPKRETLPSFLRLGAVPQSLMDLAIQQIEVYESVAKNDMCTPTYGVCHDSPLVEHFGPLYVQNLLQGPVSDPENERDYTQPLSPVTEQIQRLLPDTQFFRARLSKLPPRGILPWHIDTNTSVYCRVQLMIQGQCTWQIRRREVVDTQTMRAGEFWFANTGYPHQVENHGEIDRWVITLNADYSELAASLGDFAKVLP